MATRVTVKKPTQQGVESSLLDYYDIMVIGKTGMGKSTTVDKMVVAKPRGARRERSGSASQLPEPIYTIASRKLVCEDLTMWLVSDKPLTEKTYDDNALVKVSLRLKNLVHFSSVEKSHEEINKSRKSGMGIYDTTLECELISNEFTEVRILDVPGFFGRESIYNVENPETRASLTAGSALSTMRKVLRIKNAHSLNFKRVVYFLPEKGALRRTDQHLISELLIMETYFGRAIFDNMVVIATESLGAYRHANPTSIMFTEEDFRQTKEHLQEGLQEAFNGENVPEPPIAFISLFDTCEEIMRKVRTAEVLKSSILLEFRHSLCARCGLTIVEEGKNDSESSYCTSPNRHGSITYDESTCHPIMIPKYSKVEKVVGGVLHLVTLRKFVGRWPSFETMDEVCINCKQPPKSHGCMKIGTEFQGAKNDGIVQHSSSAVEPYQIEIGEEPDEVVESAPCSQGDGANIPVGVDASLPVIEADPIHHDLRHNLDGRYVYVQRESSPPDFEVKG